MISLLIERGRYLLVEAEDFVISAHKVWASDQRRAVSILWFSLIGCVLMHSGCEAVSRYVDLIAKVVVLGVDCAVDHR